MTSTKTFLFTLIFAILAFAQGALAQDAPAGLSVDTDYNPDQAGYYYVNMPKEGIADVVDLREYPDIVFKIYDDGGKNDLYGGANENTRGVSFLAPVGFVFEVTGKIEEAGEHDELVIFDGDNDLISPELYAFSGEDMVYTVNNIGTHTTTVNAMLIEHTPDYEHHEGFELTVSMKPNPFIHDITIDPQHQPGGTWASDAVGGTGVATHEVNLTFTPEANRVISSVKVIKTGDALTEVELTKLDDTHYRFTMPDYDVTVVPGAYDWEWTSGNTICHLDNQGVFTVSAIAGTDGAMADYTNQEDSPWVSANVDDDITSVIVQPGVTVIGRKAFAYCDYISSVSLPAGLLEIRYLAFNGCTRLSSITIPYTVTNVSYNAFYSCTGLAHVYNQARAEDIGWGSSNADFMQDPNGIEFKITKMHVFPSQLQAYQSKFRNLNVTFVGNLEASGNWTDAGNYASSFSNENGNTITIMNEAEMARFAYLVNAGNTYKDKTIKLGTDLNMYSHNWVPIGTDQRPFEGIFDGQDHTINGIVVNRSGSAYNGLFGYVGGYDNQSALGIVRNVSLKQSSITGGDYTGGLVGYLLYGKVENCFTDASVSGSQYVGGLVGAMIGETYNNRINAYVTNSLYMGSHVSGSQNVSAVVGGKLNNRCTITSYYTNKSVSTTSQLDIYAVKAVDESTADITVSYDGSGKVVYNGDTYGATNGTANIIVHATDPYKKISSIVINDVQVATKAGSFSFGTCSSADVCSIRATLSDVQLAGSGTEADPYRISNMDEWNLFAELVAGGATFSGKFVKQTNQIGEQGQGSGPHNGITTMVGESEALSFQGTYDGSTYYIISSINSTADYAAPFRFVKNATIKNIKMAGTFNVGKHGSALVGRTYGTTLIDTVWVHAASITSSRNDNGDRYMGGVVGHGGSSSTLTMKNVLFDAEMINDGGYTGGLLGWADGGWTDGITFRLDSCTFRGSFSGNGAFHPIAVRNSYKPMNTTAKNVYFYTGPKNIDNAHIAVSAIRVQSEPPADGSYGTAVDALTGNKTCYYYNDAPQGLRIDYDKERGSAGYYFVNLQCENTNQRVVLGSGITSFMVYDDGGKLSDQCASNYPSKLTVVAPNNLLEVQGRVVELDPEFNYLSIGDDAGRTLFYYGGGGHSSANIPSATTAGHVLYISVGNDGEFMQGFEIQVTLQSDGKFHYGAVMVESDYSLATIDGAYMGDEETVIPEDIRVDGVVLDRNFTIGKFSTVMLPFDMSDFGGLIDLNRVHGAKFYGLSQMQYKDGKWTAGATEITGYLTANKPYLVKPTDTRITFDGEVYLNTGVASERKTVRDGWEFRGTYKRFVFGDSAEILGNAYGFVAKDTILSGKEFSAGQFVKAGPRAYIQPMRAYLVRVGDNSNAKNASGLGEFGELPEVIDLKIMDEHGNVTETATINTRTGEIKRDRWFDLQGRQLKGKPTERGKYLHNGKVEVIR